MDESKLLEVFLAKDREIWLEDIEELENDGEDAIKMPRSACSAEMPRQEAFLHDDGVVALVEAFSFRGESQIHPFSLAEGEILLDGLRVVL